MSGMRSPIRSVLGKPAVAVVAGLAAASMILAGCGEKGSGASGGKPDQVTVGAISYLTGTYATFGLQAQQGIRLAEARVNDKRLLLGGAHLTVNVEDDSSEPTQSLSIARRFAANPSIPAMLGPIGSPPFFAVNPVADAMKMPIVSIGSATPVPHDEISKWITRVNLAGTQSLMQSYLEFAAEHLGTQKVSIIYDKANEASASDKNLITQTASKAGVQLAGEPQAYKTGDTNFGTQIEAILKANPDTMYVADGGPAWALIMQQARERGFKGQFIGGTGLNNPAAAEQAPEATKGYVTFVPVNVKDPSPQVQEFVKLFKKTYPKDEVTSYAVWGYDATMLLVDAMNRAGSTDRDAIRKALGSTSGWAGVSGTYTIDGWGDNTKPTAYVAKLQPDMTLKVIGSIGS